MYDFDYLNMFLFSYNIPIYICKGNYSLHWFIIYAGYKFELHSTTNNICKLSITKYDSNSTRFNVHHAGNTNCNLYQLEKYCLEYVDKNKYYSLIGSNCQDFVVDVVSYATSGFIIKPTVDLALIIAHGDLNVDIYDKYYNDKEDFGRSIRCIPICIQNTYEANRDIWCIRLGFHLVLFNEGI